MQAGGAVAGGAGVPGSGIKRKRQGQPVTVSEMNEDALMAVARKNWTRGSEGASKKIFKPKLVREAMLASEMFSRGLVFFLPLHIIRRGHQEKCVSYRVHVFDAHL